MDDDDERDELSPSEGLARFIAAEVEALLGRHGAYLAGDARQELTVLRDAMLELGRRQADPGHVAWSPIRRAA